MAVCCSLQHPLGHFLAPKFSSETYVDHSRDPVTGWFASMYYGLHGEFNLLVNQRELVNYTSY